MSDNETAGGKPSNYTRQPFNSIFLKSEAETVARNIMVILARTGNEWRPLPWKEYETERLKDGAFSSGEEDYFLMVEVYCRSPETAARFSPVWGNDER